MGSGVHTDLSEDRRLAQLKRIEELRTKIGSIPQLKQGQSSTASCSSGSFSGLASPCSSSNSSHAGFAKIPSSEIALGPEYSSSNSFRQDDTTELRTVDWATDQNQRGSLDSATSTPQLSSVPDVANDVEISDETTGSQRIGSTSSKRSPNSSNTSTEIPNVKIKQEDDYFTQLDSQVDNIVAQPSNVSGLTPVESAMPATLTIVKDSNQNSAKRRKIVTEQASLFSNFKPKTSIPSKLPHGELARQSVEAALASRLNPFVLHPEEYQILRQHICHLHVSAYINIRNRILRLWVRNPLVTVTPEEAAGCAYSSKWLGLAEVAYEWLVRRGYINFGCVQVPDLSDLKVRKHRHKTARRTIVVVGAGMSGLGCARQLEGLFSHYREAWTVAGEDTPQIIVLEGRSRVGGRIYSHPLQNQASKGIPKHLRCTAEMGAHIITGFNHGNPLNMIIRGQLALHYHPLKDNSSLFDVDGRIVNRDRDLKVEELFNDILDRSSLYRHKLQNPATVEGDRELIENARDPSGDAGKPISVVEEEENALVNKPATLSEQGLMQVPAGLDKLTGKAHVIAGSREKVPSTQAVQAMGWQLRNGAEPNDLDLGHVVETHAHPTLGVIMDHGVQQYQSLLELSAQDLRLLNWHFANLEYANAANLNKLSLGAWDQDLGNEFEGEHSQVIGGYTQVPRGILEYPHQLDVRTRKTVTRIEYDAASSGEVAKVICDSGEVLEADHVVITAPLGVLKKQSIDFEPRLPESKAKSIERLGFGLLNKVVLVYDKPFWDVDQDMIGLLRDTNQPGSLDHGDYSTNRGRFYLFWNCVKTSGRPVLISLMAGDAAFQAESLSDGQIVWEVTQQLANMYKNKAVPLPSEAIVTRWGRDKFAYGTYSYVGPEARAEDYDCMAQRLGNLHFAGEATCRTHPATVHGAYISGLRAASEIIDDLLGPIAIPQPLVPEIIKLDQKTPATTVSRTPQKVEAGDVLANGETAAQKQARLEAFESEILKAIFAKLGLRPDKPGKQGANPFLLYSKEKWGECKERCDGIRRAVTGNGQAKATRNDIRAVLGKMWREAPEEVKKPYIDRTVTNRATNHENASTFQDRLNEWDAEAMSIRREYVKSHPAVLSRQEEQDMWQALGVYAGMDRKAKKMSGYADASDDDMNKD
ncbi:MAG: hypothetical protein LQ340_005112 [Diploschistes diacapsis]|nr:MAG: hypothetical protein LQ340_005112 [Diploschistes diacapsis]